MIYEVRSSILGFDNIKKVKIEKLDGLFCKMTDVDNENLSFTLINPFALAPNYEFDLPDDFANSLELPGCKEFKVYNMVVLDSEVSTSKINFLAPLLINEDIKAVGQAVLTPANTKDTDSVLKPINNFVS
jgi:flagellar assembly factor FliW